MFSFACALQTPPPPPLIACLFVPCLCIPPLPFTDMLVSGITQACTNACSIVPGFYSCFCVCFKNRVINAGLAWGLPITCN